MSLFDDVKSGVTEGFEVARKDVTAGYQAVKAEAVMIAQDPVGSLKSAGEWVYDQALGNDIKTLRDPEASTLDKVLAGVSIASNFVGPEGKLIDKGLTVLAKEALEHGGEKLLATGAAKLEETLGKDAMKELAAHGEQMYKSVEKGVEFTEKVLDKLNIARNVKESLTNTLEDMKATFRDTQAAIAAKPGDRAAAWATVTKDLAKDALDVKSLGTAAWKAKDAIHPEKPASLAHLQRDATNTLLQDAERFKGDSGRTFVEGENLIIDVRTSKNFIASTDAMLKGMSAEAKDAGKHMVVYDPNVSIDQERKLLADGIAVAKTPAELTKLSVAAKAPGGLGIELINLDKHYNDNEIVMALSDRKEKREAIETLDKAPAFVASGPAEVGAKHEHAKAWDGKSSALGSISWARDGEVQQYYRGGWIKYEAAQLEGDRPIEGHQVTIRPDPANPGMAIVSDPLQRQQQLGQQLEPAQAHGR